MSSSATTSPWPLRFRLGIAALVLLVEYLLISFAFDARTVAARGGVWSALGEAGRIGPLLVVAATSFLLLPPLRGENVEQSQPKSPNALLLLLHAVLAGAFVWATAAAFGGETAPSGPAILWMLGWAALGAATAATLFVGVLGEWRWLARTLAQALVAGGALGLLAWLAGSLSTELWAPLSYATFLTVAAILRTLSFDLFVDKENVVLALDGFAVDVAPVCSGFEGIGLFTVLIAGFLFRFRESLRFPRALLLVPVGIVAVWVGNAVRISLLMVLGARVDAGLALGSFHSKAGWVFFCAITLGIAVLGKKLPFFAKKDVETEPSVAFDNPTAPLLVPILAWIGVGLVTSMLSEGHDPLYVLRVLVVGATLWMYRDAYRRFLERPTVLAWVVGVVVGVVWLLPIPGAPTPEDAMPLGEGWALWVYVGWIVARCVGAVVIIPMCEEFAFRGYLARWFTKREFWDVSFGNLSLLAVVLSSVAFGFLHERFVLATITGVIYALLLRRTQRMIDAVAAHAASNAVIAVWVIATGNFQHW